MKPRRLLIPKLMVLATAGTALVLLVANCAQGPTCEETTFKREYAVTTDCGTLRGTRLSIDWRGIDAYAAVPFSTQGNLAIEEVTLDGQCAEDGKAEFKKLSFMMDSNFCEVDLVNGKATEAICKGTDSSPQECYVQFQPLE